MTGEEFIKFHAVCCEKMQAICKAKNADYAGAKGGADAFANFKMVEHFGVASVEQGMLTRMSDKFARIASFVAVGTLKVKDESVEDTLLDFANYCILLAGFIHSKRAKVPDEMYPTAVEAAAFKSLNAKCDSCGQILANGWVAAGSKPWITCGAASCIEIVKSYR